MEEGHGGKQRTSLRTWSSCS